MSAQTLSPVSNSQISQAKRSFEAALSVYLPLAAQLKLGYAERLHIRLVAAAEACTDRYDSFRYLRDQRPVKREPIKTVAAITATTKSLACSTAINDLTRYLIGQLKDIK